MINYDCNKGKEGFVKCYFNDKTEVEAVIENHRVGPKPFFDLEYKLLVFFQ